ncbi:MAG: hypothetical protein ACRCZI_14910 [Cetobacterium sp.]
MDTTKAEKFYSNMTQQHQSDSDFIKFVGRFLTGRISWLSVPRVNAITNFGNIISFVIYRKDQYQVELFIVPSSPSSFTNHRHPDVDTYEFPLSGDNTLYFDGRPIYTEAQINVWLSGLSKSQPVHISPSQYHSGDARTPYAFLSIQYWLNGVPPSSVGLNWDGELSSSEQAYMLNGNPDKTPGLLEVNKSG